MARIGLADEAPGSRKRPTRISLEYHCGLVLRHGGGVALIFTAGLTTARASGSVHLAQRRTRRYVLLSQSGVNESLVGAAYVAEISRDVSLGKKKTARSAEWLSPDGKNKVLPAHPRPQRRLSPFYDILLLYFEQHLPYTPRLSVYIYIYYIFWGGGGRDMYMVYIYLRSSEELPK